MAYMRDERLVALGLGVAVVGCMAAMRLILELCRDEAEIKPTPPKTQYITQDTEDSLKLSTLQSLLQHYNFSIRDTAVRIVAGRALNDESALDDFLWGITRPDYEQRINSLSALVYAIEDKDIIGSYQESLVPALNTPKAYSAIVRSLELSLDDFKHERLDDPLHDEWDLRDIGERNCLVLVSHLIHKYGVESFVSASFVERWLAKQPWGDTEEERRTNFENYISRKKNKIAHICFHLKSSKAGLKALVSAKLTTKPRKSKRERSSNIKVVLEISMANDDEGNSVLLEETELVPRVNDQSAEEQRLRRRHREAMVLNDGTHSLDRGDIIEREHDANS